MLLSPMMGIASLLSLSSPHKNVLDMVITNNTNKYNGYLQLFILLVCFIVALHLLVDCVPFCDMMNQRVNCWFKVSTLKRFL